MDILYKIVVRAGNFGDVGDFLAANHLLAFLLGVVSERDGVGLLGLDEHLRGDFGVLEEFA